MADWPDSVLQQNRIVTIWGDIDEDVTRLAHAEILAHAWDSRREAITLIVSSCGGSVSEMWALIDVMHAIECPVRTVAIGKVRSAGLMIAIAGDRRYCLESTEYMSHEDIWGGRDGHSQRMARRPAEDSDYQRSIEHMIRHSRYKTPEEIKEQLVRPVEVWMTARDALGHGLVDDVWTSLPGRENDDIRDCK